MRRILLIVIAIAVIGYFVNAEDRAPSFAESPGTPLESTARPTPMEEPEILVDGDTVLFRGNFTAGSADKLIARLDRLQKPILGLESSGGLVAEALEVGAYVRENGIDTFVPTYCASACVYVFAAGAERFVGYGTRIGVHGLSSGDPSQTSFKAGQVAAATLATYLVSMGVSPMIELLGAQIDPEDMHWLTLQEMKEYGLATSVIEEMELTQAVAATSTPQPVRPGRLSEGICRDFDQIR
jgi:hypothetical protein